MLLDANVPHALRHDLRRFEVTTAQYAGLAHLQNGLLLSAAEDEGFEVFVTLDRNIVAQQLLSSRRIAVVCLRASNQLLPNFQRLIPGLVEAIRSARPGSYTVVGDR
ncbi:MAG: DUF5615 family PIN-like protein [Pseudomonadota bacterium]